MDDWHKAALGRRTTLYKDVTEIPKEKIADLEKRLAFYAKPENWTLVHHAEGSLATPAEVDGGSLASEYFEKKEKQNANRLSDVPSRPPK